MTGWITLAISLTALAASAVALVTVRGRWRAHASLTRSLAAAIARLAAAVAEMNAGLDRLSGETRLTVAVGELAEATDLEEALTRIAEAAAHVSGAQSAVVRAVPADGNVVVGSTHPAPDVAFAPEIEWPPTGARAMTFTFLHDRDAGGEPRAGSGLALPIGSQAGSPVALLSVLFAEPGHAARAVTELESLAARAAPIVAGLLDARAAERPGKDELTGLPTRTTFHDTLAREAARARRHGAPLAVVVVDVNALRGVNERLGRSRADAALAALARCVESVLPPGAVACRIGGDELALVLPATSRRDAELLLARLDAERIGDDRARELTVAAGTAELMLTDDPISLFERATKSLHAVKTRPPNGAGPSIQSAHEQG
jgi:diguanylate cyclase (GGDEF)-like protein